MYSEVCVINYIKLLKQPIAFHRIYATLGGGAGAGVFISQLMYWHEKMSKHHGEDWDGWFYKNGKEWEEETGVTRHEREKTEKLLKGLEIIKIKKKGIPPTKNYKVNEYLFNKAIEDLLNGKMPSKPSKDAKLQDSAKHNAESGDINGEIQQIISPDVAVQAGKSGDINGEIQPYITEITTETTSETTTQTLSASEKTEDGVEGGCSDDSMKTKPWVSLNGKELTGKKLEIFIMLWETFDYKKDRADAIDKYLEKIWPMLGGDRDTNHKIIKTLLDAIKIHVGERKDLKPTSSPTYFTNWILKQRWEDEVSLPAKTQSKAGSNINQEVPDGFNSQADYQEYSFRLSNYRMLSDLKNPSALQVQMMNDDFERLTALKPQQTEEKAA